MVAAMTRKMTAPGLALVLLLGGLTGCASRGPNNALLWFETSAERKAAYEEIYRLAGKHVAAAKPKGHWGVILDADETLLNNSPFQREMDRRGIDFDGASWTEWVKKREAERLPGSKDFLDRVHALGGLVLVVTNREESVCDDTRDNLAKQELRVDQVLCAPPQVSDKNPRFESLMQGTSPGKLGPLNIVAFVGDNILDFPHQSQEQYDRARFGVDFFLLPNPMYGSWQPKH